LVVGGFLYRGGGAREGAEAQREGGGRGGGEARNYRPKFTFSTQPKACDPERIGSRSRNESVGRRVGRAKELQSCGGGKGRVAEKNANEKGKKGKGSL